jgi:hypothetical protein
MSAWITVHCGLFYLLYHSDQSWQTVLGISKAEIREYRDLCASNSNRAVERLHLLMEPTLDNIQALNMASSVYMDTARPSVAWVLISVSCRMCLDLGLHRQSTNNNNAMRREQRVLFWYAYACDKGLALNFGRTPNIHDYDITVERPRVPDDLDDRAFGRYFLGWLDFAEFQGVLMEQLFSARAQEAPQEERTRRALFLVEQMNQLQDEFRDVSIPPNEPFVTRLLITDSCYRMQKELLPLTWKMPCSRRK